MRVVRENEVTALAQLEVQRDAYIRTYTHMYDAVERCSGPY